MISPFARFYMAALLTVLCSWQMSGTRYLLDGEDLYVSSRMDSSHDVICHFRKCMYNELYTFYRVGMVSNTGADPVSPKTPMTVIINATGSDNIGPWGISGEGWAGGNHSWHEGGAVRTARTVEWGVYADGVKVDAGEEGYADRLTVEVRNEIYDPRYGPAADSSILSVPLCIEKIIYVLDGSSMTVRAEHHFVCREPVEVSRYYGMQSMFCGETQIFAPGMENSGWMSAPGNALKIRKSDAPDFRFFTERRNDECFQTTCLRLPGLGGHAFVPDESPVFIYASYGKSYHVLADSYVFRNGDVTRWEGVYTWFAKPLADDAELFCHEGRIDLKRAVYVSCMSAVDRMVKISGVTMKTGTDTIYFHGDVAVEPAEGGISIKSSGPSCAIIIME